MYNYKIRSDVLALVEAMIIYADGSTEMLKLEFGTFNSGEYTCSVLTKKEIVVMFYLSDTPLKCSNSPDALQALRRLGADCYNEMVSKFHHSVKTEPGKNEPICANKNTETVVNAAPEAPKTLGDYYGVIHHETTGCDIVGKIIFQFMSFRGEKILSLDEFGCGYESTLFGNDKTTKAFPDVKIGHISEQIMRDFLNIMQPLFVIETGKLPIYTLGCNHFFKKMENYRDKQIGKILKEVEAKLSA